MDKCPPPKAGDRGSIPGPRETAYPPEQLSPVPQLPRPHTGTSEVCTLQQEKPLQSEAHAPQERVARAPESTERLPLQGRPSQKYIHSLNYSLL